MSELKLMQFGSLSGKPLDWVILDETEEDYLLISVDPFGKDNALYLKKFFEENIIAKYFSEEEINKIEEVRLFTIDEYEVYSQNMDLHTPYHWYLEQDLESYNGDVQEIYFTIVASRNVKNNPDYQETFDIIQSIENGKVISTQNRDAKEVGWDYGIRPVIRVLK